MATRRRGGADLSDLKARLGLKEEEEKKKAEEEKAKAEAEAKAKAEAEAKAAAAASAPAAGDAAPAAASAASPAKAAPAGKAAAAPASRKAAAPGSAPGPEDFDLSNLNIPELQEPDYATTVADVEPEAVEFDAHAVDPSLKAPGSKIPIPFIVAIVGVGIAALVFGWIGRSVMQSRGLHNAQVNQAGTVLEAVQDTASDLTGLNNTLQTITLDSYSTEFEDAVRGVYSSAAPPVLETSLLTQSRALMTYDAALSRLLLDYAIGTKYLQDIVGSHMTATDREMEAINEVLNPSNEDANFSNAIVFNFEEHVARYNAFLENSEAGFLPLFGIRVTYEGDLSMNEVPEVPEGEDPPEEEPVRTFTFGLPETVPPPVVQALFTGGEGRSGNAPIYNVLLLEDNQIVQNEVAETAVDRYVRRARLIQEQLTAVVELQARLRTQLEELADEGLVFTVGS